MVFYFTGTGNSRFVAERVASALGQDATDISTFIKGGGMPSYDREETYVFACPCYMSAPARSMTDFIEKTEFPKGVKAYFAVTCAVAAGISPRVLRELCERKGFEYMGTAQVPMPQNYIALFKMADREGCKESVKAALPIIDKLIEHIKAGTRQEDKRVSPIEYPMTVWVRDVYYKHFMKTKKFRITDKCVSCGKCAKVCPLGNIVMEDGKPKWGDNCTHCMGCINLCPKDAVEFGKGSVGKHRYKGPEV